MTQVGGGRGAVSGGPVAGELLAERYQLEQHVNTDHTGRQIWYGVDVVLRRPVAVVIRYPGGAAATQMLQSAVEGSRIVHPNLVSVYDAIDEQARAYVVREWVDGASLRDHLHTGPFDADRAVAVAHAVGAAVTAVHSTGMTHGNVHPGTVLIGRDGRVMVADARADGTVPSEEDIRAVGGVLYYALTGLWPHPEVAGPDSLPDAMRDSTGALAAPRQIRPGVPDHLDNLVMDLLDRRLSVPPAEVLAGELARLDAPYEETYYQDTDTDTDTGPVRLTDRAPAPGPSGRKIALGVGALLVIAVVGLLAGLNLLGSPSEESPGASGPTGDPPASQAPDGVGESTPAPIPLTADQLRIIDPPEGTRTELEGVEALVDDDPGTVWSTDQYYDGLQVVKPGIGILIDLGEERELASVIVEMSTAGAVAELRTGDNAPPAGEAGDAEIIETYTPIGEPRSEGSTMVFSGFDSDSTYRYLMVWFTELPEVGDGHQVEVQRVGVEGR